MERAGGKEQKGERRTGGREGRRGQGEERGEERKRGREGRRKKEGRRGERKERGEKIEMHEFAFSFRAFTQTYAVAGYNTVCDRMGKWRLLYVFWCAMKTGETDARDFFPFLFLDIGKRKLSCMSYVVLRKCRYVVFSVCSY